MSRIEGTRRVEQPPPDGFKGELGAPPVTARRPSNRHSVTRVNNRNKAKPGDQNTMIDAWVDVDADLAAINTGRGLYDKETSRVWVNGRLYGMHLDTGTVWPIEGDGFFQVSQTQHSALRVIAKYNGINEQSERELLSNPAFTDEDRDLARRIWRMREQAEAT